MLVLKGKIIFILTPFADAQTEIFATAIIMVGIVPTGFQVVYAQVLDRDVEAPTPGLNGTASTEPPDVSIDMSPLESLPI